MQWTFGTNFLFHFEPVVRNLDGKRVEVFSTLFGPAVRIIQEGKKSSPIRCLFSLYKDFNFPVRVRLKENRVIRMHLQVSVCVWREGGGGGRGNHPLLAA